MPLGGNVFRLLSKVGSPHGRWIAVGLVAASVGLATWTQARYAGLGVLDQIDVVFEADPSDSLQEFAHGDGFWTYKHPLESYLVAIPARLIGLAAGVFAGPDFDARAFRSRLVRVVMPIMAGLRTVVLLLLLAVLGVPEPFRLSLTALDISAFSTIVFSGLPE